MAEFTEVMRQAKRLCAAHDSTCTTNNCPLDGGEACRLNIDLDGEDYNELERIIMDWAKEHPEPVYPSWEAAWRQLFPDANCVPCPDSFGIKYGVPECAHLACTACKSRPIPAAVAEKLGIEPIAPEKPVPEHDGCNGCKWIKREGTDEPCVRCKGTMYGDSKKPDLWEAAK